MPGVFVYARKIDCWLPGTCGKTQEGQNTFLTFLGCGETGGGSEVILFTHPEEGWSDAAFLNPL